MLIDGLCQDCREELRNHQWDIDTTLESHRPTGLTILIRSEINYVVRLRNGGGGLNSNPHTHNSSLRHISLVSILILILVLDLYKIISHQTVTKLFYPIIIVSNITLTIHIIHPVFAVFEPSFIPSESNFRLYSRYPRINELFAYKQ